MKLVNRSGTILMLEMIHPYLFSVQNLKVISRGKLDLCLADGSKNYEKYERIYQKLYHS